MRFIVLAHATDADGFRRWARALLAEGVPPAAVSWSVAGSAEQGLFTGDSDTATPLPEAAPSRVAVPAAFVELMGSVLLHRDPGRFALLYRLLWRLVHEPGLRHDPLDADRVQAQHMAQAVRRDIHKMRAFVRFRRIEPDAEADGAEPLHVAWFEPEHHIVEANAPFFARRFAGMRWAILTPERSVRWDGERLAFGPGGRREDAPEADAGEALWLTYYQSIFNPARLKLAAMKKEMPVRYWHNLPESALIAPLTAQAAERSGRMVEAEPTEPRRRLPAAPPRPGASRPGVCREDAEELTAMPSPRSSGGPSPAAPDLFSPADLEAVAAPARASARRIPLQPLAATHDTLASLKGAMNHCHACPIGEHATQAVAGEGAENARLMLVGEQPGDQEDLRGRPFVGPAGQLLATAMGELGWPREAVYITNAVKHFKFELRGKRRLHKTPTQQEAAVCLEWLEREIALVQPQALVALGATAARSLLGRAVAITKERGQWFTREDGRPVLVTLHPSALLRMQGPERDEAYAPWVRDLAQATRHVQAVDGETS